jgi:hypothetical protein
MDKPEMKCGQQDKQAANTNASDLPELSPKSVYRQGAERLRSEFTEIS